MSGKLKIAQVTTADMALRFLLLDQIIALQQMGHEVVAICAPGAWVRELREKGVCVETVPMRREPHPAADLRTLAALYGTFKRHQFDVVHTHTPKAGLLGPIAARMAHVPVVLHTIHGLLFHDGMSPVEQMLYWMPEKLTATFAHRLLSQSREDVDRATAAHLCRPAKIRWIGNGIDVQRFSRTCVDGGARREFGLRPTDFVVGCVGRLVREKGFEELLHAADSLVPRYPDLRFLIIGFDEHRHSKAIPCSRFDALVQLGKVTFVGARRDMPRCYAAMDLLVHPSHREGVPRACLEAAAMELPVIASDIRGCREAVIPGETGELVPVRNSRALAHAIERMMQNPPLCRARGIAGRQFVLTNFDARFVLNRLEEVYADIARQLRGETGFAGASQGIADSV